MTAKYYAILTNQGAAKLAAATALGTQIHITQMAVGDGNGSLPTPDATQTQLLNQKRIGAVNTLTVDAANANQIIAEQVIPENEGGYWIREMGLFDDDGVLIAIANCPETYKPLLQEGSGRTQTIRMALIVSSTAAVTLKIDPSVVLATRKYVDDKVIEVKAYSDELMKQHVAASNPHAQYAKVSELAKKQPFDDTLTKLSGKDVEELIQYLGLGATVTNAAGAMQKNANGGDIVNQLIFLENIGVNFTIGSGYIILKVGAFIIACGNANATTTSEGNLNVTLPTTFPNTVMYSNATQANSSYATDTTPIIYSPYAISAGPVTAAGYAARNSKTGAALINTAVAARYLVVGF